MRQKGSPDVSYLEFSRTAALIVEALLSLKYGPPSKQDEKKV